jgi:hypothetical protein
MDTLLHYTSLRVTGPYLVATSVTGLQLQIPQEFS